MARPSAGVPQLLEAIGTDHAGRRETPVQPAGQAPTTAPATNTARSYRPSAALVLSKPFGGVHRRSFHAWRGAPFEKLSREETYKDFLNLIRKTIPELNDADFLWLHATTAKRAAEIIESGFDVNLTGANFDGSSLHGKGVYTTWIASYAVEYAKHAVEKEGSDSQDGDVAQIFALFAMPDERKSAPADYVIPRVEGEEGGIRLAIELTIPEKELKTGRFIGVPLPPFPLSECDNVKNWLRYALEDRVRGQKDEPATLAMELTR